MFPARLPSSLPAEHTIRYTAACSSIRAGIIATPPKSPSATSPLPRTAAPISTHNTAVAENK